MPQRIRLETVRDYIQRVLVAKFGIVPESVIETIEASNDVEQLDHWLEQSVVANSIDDLDLK